MCVSHTLTNTKKNTLAWRLNVVIPFHQNEILDKRSQFVRISNVYIDTSDGVSMCTQIEITNKDQFTRELNLSFSNCDILERLNISHSFTLTPNKSTLINLTFPIPFIAEHKEQKCKGGNFFFTKPQ